MSDFYDRSGDRNSSNNHSGGNNEDYGWVSWLLIIIFFSTGLWFIALPLLFYKLFGPDKKETKQRQAPPLRYNPAQDAANQQTQQHQQAQPRQRDRQRERQHQRERTEDETKARDAVKSVTRSPATNSKSALTLMIFGAMAAAAGIFAITNPIQAAVIAGTLSGQISAILQAAAILAGGVGMFLGGISIKAAMKRYTNYMAVIGTLEAVSVDTLAKKTGYRRKRVCKDLQKMVEKSYFGPDAYLNMELGYLFRSSKADEELAAARSAAEKKTEEARAQSAGGYEAILRDIRTANDRIADPVISEKIDRLENITSQIFKAVERDPSKRAKIDTFFSYYLPTTLKLLDSYAQLESTEGSGENITQTKKSIESTMDSIIHGFEHQLDELYKDDALDIQSDIEVMKTMMNREISSAASDFAVKPQTPAPAPGQPAPKDVDMGGSAAQQK